jgi:hypothetical protein
MEKLKHRLPSYSIIDHLCIDNQTLQDLKSCIEELDPDFKSVLEINKGLCGIHHELASSVYDNFYQISLTDSTVQNKDITLEDCEIVHNDLNSSTQTNNIRRKQLTSTSRGVMDESTYTQKTDVYQKYQALFDSILSKFKGQTTRIRLVKLAAGTHITPHIDYDPSYAVRIILPVISDLDCLNVFWVKNKIETTSLIPGNAYFLNTGYKHAVLNFSKNHRYTFMVSIKGIEDIEHLLEK